MRNLAGQRFVSFSVNSPVNKGVVVYLDKDLVRAGRTDVNASHLRRLDVDWASLLLPFGQRWASLNLLFRRNEQITPQCVEIFRICWSRLHVSARTFAPTRLHALEKALIQMEVLALRVDRENQALRSSLLRFFLPVQATTASVPVQYERSSADLSRWLDPNQLGSSKLVRGPASCFTLRPLTTLESTKLKLN